ncbi:Phosphoglucomutase-3, partial [Ascosphaera aggregata]
LQFGTAGLRGRMQAGFSFINCLTIIQTSQGLAQYVRAVNQDAAETTSTAMATTPLVIIGHDARNNSAKYARLAANAFLALGIRVLMFSTSSPTPFVPFFVLKKKAAAGVMVTASHNPAKDNGYKVYLSNGAQINGPADKEIATAIEQNLAPWDSAWADPKTHESFGYERFEEAVDQYCGAVEHYLRSSLGVEHVSPSPLVYTPLHGVGGRTFLHMSQRLGVKDIVAAVDDQIEPNPEFPTVPFPNPEETGTLDLAMRKADSTGRKLVFANDPDADRFAVAEKYG